MIFKENNDNIVTIPKCEDCFIYFLLKNCEVVYVGKTQHGLTRPLSHRDKDFDEIKILYCNLDELDVLEDTYIQKYRPTYNKQNNYAMRWSLTRVRNCIRQQAGYENYTVPRLRKLLKELGITPIKDYYNGKETISFNEYQTIVNTILCLRIG